MRDEVFVVCIYVIGSTCGLGIRIQPTFALVRVVKATNQGI